VIDHLAGLAHPASGHGRASPARYGDGMPKDRREQPIVLSRIYTRTGDDGTTALGDMSRVAKTDPRLVAYADVDEANCAIGVALALGEFSDGVTAVLIRVQNDLFDVGADLCNPVTGNPSYPPLRVDDGYVSALERACDEQNADLPTLRSFVLPGGTPGAALLHTARTIVRRAERSTWAALAAHGESMNPLTARYLNRLSDLLFILARRANLPGGDVLWKPGGDR
jgi:cob(I)alamin adenosyltransferase